jgi:hypothetical protein
LLQQCARLSHAHLTLTIAQETKVADFNKAFRQQMQAEPTHKFPELQSHGFALTPIGVILPGKRYGLAVGVQGHQALWAQRHPVGIA